jgi:hypothetical protein
MKGGAAGDIFVVYLEIWQALKQKERPGREWPPMERCDTILFLLENPPLQDRPFEISYV